MRNVIEIEGLGKHYRRRARVTAAVDGLDLVVPEGGVFGFLGPNGSGKTTTIRCVLGLARATAGSVRLLGCRVPGDVRDAVRRTGAIVETPASFPTMTARENLRLLASIDGIGRRRVDEVLEEVGLGERAGDLVKRFSRWLWAENLATVMTWSRLDDADFARGPVLAAATLFVYVGVVVGLSAFAFGRRDVTGVT